MPEEEPGGDVRQDTDPGRGITRQDRPAGADEAQPELELDGLRARITEIDAELVRLVGARRDLVLRVGRVKARLGLPILDPAREAAVVRRAAALSRDLGIDEELTRDVIWRIIASARQAQEGRTTWGPESTSPEDD